MNAIKTSPRGLDIRVSIGEKSLLYPLLAPLHDEQERSDALIALAHQVALRSGVSPANAPSSKPRYKLQTNGNLIRLDQ